MRIVCTLFALAAFVSGAAGAEPQVTIHIGHNETFIFPDASLHYVVVVSTDRGDTLAGTIDSHRTAITLRYVEDDAAEMAPQPVDERILLGALRGRSLIAGNDCVVCHFESSSVPQAIPTYTQIAARFAGNLDAAPALAVKIHNGSQHAWGEIPMPGHPDLSDQDATAIAYYILSFANDQRREFLPVTATVPVPLAEHLVSDRFGARLPGRFLLTASYSDPQTADPAQGFGFAVKRLRYANVPAGSYDAAEGIRTVEIEGEELVSPDGAQGYVVFRDIDLGGIASISALGLGSSAEWPGGSVELRLDSARGVRLGSGRLAYDGPDFAVGRIRVALAPLAGRHDLYVQLRGKIALARLCFGCDDGAGQR